MTAAPTIHGNGHAANGNGNGNGKSRGRNCTSEIGGFVLAEGLGMGVALGAMYAMQHAPKPLIDIPSTMLGKLMEPVQPQIEKIMRFFCKLEECKPDESKPVSERSKDLARVVIMGSTAMVANWWVKLRFRRYWNEKMGLKDSHEGGNIFNFSKWTPEEKMLFFADEGVHYLAMGVMPSAPMAKYTDPLIRRMTKAMEDLGWSKQDAHENAVLIALHEIPNLIGGLFACATIAGRHYLDWPTGWVGKLLGKKPNGTYVERVAQQAAQGAGQQMAV